MQEKRESGIELLKIGAIFMIVISHVVQTLGETGLQMKNYPIEAFIDLSKATTDIEVFLLQNMMYLGSLGNLIFFICSAWYLCESKKMSLKKVIAMCLDVWIISVVYLVVMLSLGVNISGEIIIRSIFPTTFANNWYITFYILIYAIHPILNLVIERLSQGTLLRVCMISSILYFGICFIKRTLFFSSHLVIFCVLYFCVAYIKKYAQKITMNVKLNVKILIMAILANMCLIFITDILGIFGEQYVEGLGAQALHWCSNNNPILIIIALSSFNIFKELHFVNKKVNYISSLSLLIYVLHENIIFSKYIRPHIYVYIYETFGYDYLLLWVFLFVIILFLLSTMIAVIYQQTLRKVTSKIADKISPKLLMILDNVEEKVNKIMG